MSAFHGCTMHIIHAIMFAQNILSRSYPCLLHHPHATACFPPQAGEAVPGSLLPSEEADWDSRRLLSALEQSLVVSGLLPAVDLRAAMQQAQAVLFEATQQQHLEGEEAVTAGEGGARPAPLAREGSSSMSAPQVGVSASPGSPGGQVAPGRGTEEDSAAGQGGKVSLQQLLDLNDLALMVDMAQVRGRGGADDHRQVRGRGGPLPAGERRGRHR